MRIAVIGAKGQVGWELARRAPLLGHEALAWDMVELDITDAAAVDRALAASGADAVINAAAYTAVSYTHLDVYKRQQLTQPQGKLVWVTRGAVFDVAVDVRRGSPHFGRWYGCVLDLSLIHI